MNYYQLLAAQTAQAEQVAAAVLPLSDLQAPIPTVDSRIEDAIRKTTGEPNLTFNDNTPNRPMANRQLRAQVISQQSQIDLLVQQIVSNQDAVLAQIQAEAEAAEARFLALETAEDANEFYIQNAIAVNNAQDLKLLAQQNNTLTNQQALAAAQLLIQTTQESASQAIDLATAAQAKATTTEQAAINLAARFKKKRISSPGIAVGASAKITFVWDAPFADTNYTFSAPVYVGGTATGLGISITDKTATGAAVNIKNTLGLVLLAGAAIIEINAIHD